MSTEHLTPEPNCIHFAKKVGGGVTQLGQAVPWACPWCRIAELEQNEVRWINARDIWATDDKRKDAKIAELKHAMNDAIVAMNNGHYGIAAVTLTSVLDGAA